MSSPILLRPDRLLRSLRAHFVPTYDPGTAWMQAVSAHLYLPGLRGFWPFSSTDESENAYDLSGQGRTLTPQNGATTAVPADSIFPYASLLSSASRYFSRADEAGLDITGELTFGGWFYFTTTPASSMGLLSKNEPTGNQRAYTLFKLSTNAIRFQVSSNGTATTAVDSTATVATGTWYFIAGRYTPSSELAIWLDDEKTINTTSIPAAIFDSSAGFAVGRTDGGNYLNGRAALCFVCAKALSDDTISVLSGRMKPLFAK